MSIILDPRFEPPSPMELIQQTLQAGRESGLSAQDMAVIIKELVALRQSEERFAWEREERQAKIDFDGALNRCQKAIGRIAPNVKRNDTNSWWADYAQLDRELRTIYTDEGFSVGYSEEAPIHAGKVRICGLLSRGGVSREFYAEITPTTVGPKGGAMATATDADAIAMARAKRYILIDIFNVAVGIDKQEKQGVPLTQDQEAKLADWEEALRQSPDASALKGVFADAYKYAKSVGNQEKAKMSRVYEDCKRRFL